MMSWCLGNVENCFYKPFLLFDSHMVKFLKIFLKTILSIFSDVSLIFSFDIIDKFKINNKTTKYFRFFIFVYFYFTLFHLD